MRYGTYKQRCEELQQELNRLSVAGDRHDLTIEYLLENAEAMLKAAKALTEIRLPHEAGKGGE